jgi:hypothetical protein
MTAKSAFSEDEWSLVAEGPVTAGMILSRAESGGTFRETWAVARAYAEARQQHGESELLDEIVSSKPEFDRHRYRSDEQLRSEGLQRLADAVALLGAKATPEELGDYREFVVAVADKVARAHEEEGHQTSPAEQAALDDIRARLEGAN